MYDYYTVPPIPKGKAPLLLFSGGVDSTARLLALVRDNQHTDVVAIDAQVAERKCDLETKARANILSFLRSRYLNCKVMSYGRYGWGVASPPIELRGMIGQNFQFRQVLPWITGALMAVTDNTAHVEVAYVRGDDVSAYLPAVAEAFRLLSMVIVGREVRLYFPLALNSKGSLYTYLHGEPLYAPIKGRRQQTLLDLTWVCELPTQDNAPCGTCVPCVRERDVRRLEKLKPRAKSLVHLDPNRQIDPHPAYTLTPTETANEPG